jgi:hypothetical protein
MVISDCFVIERPYGKENVGFWHEGSGEDVKQNGANGGFKGDLERFRRVVEFELEKASLRMGGGGSALAAGRGRGAGVERKGG